MIDFVLIAIFGSIGLTLLLASLLWRLNRPRGGPRRDGGGGGERAHTIDADAGDGGDGGGD